MFLSHSVSVDWLRGLDLNQRPLGYEGKISLHMEQLQPSNTKKTLKNAA
jgi:hypothetical protein